MFFYKFFIINYLHFNKNFNALLTKAVLASILTPFFLFYVDVINF